MPRPLSPEAFGAVLYGVLRLCSATGAGLALLMGRFMLAAILVAVAVGISIRLWRKPVRPPS